MPKSGDNSGEGDQQTERCGNQECEAGEKDYPLSDGDGLDILITTRADEHGGKYWRFHFRFAGKQDTLRLGVYPAVPPVEARRKKLEAKDKLAEGVNPGEAGKQQKALFETVGLDWRAQYRESFSLAYRKSLHTHLLKHLFPSLDKLAVDGIGEKDLARVLQAIVDAGHTETAHRVLRTAKFIFRPAVMRPPPLSLPGGARPAVCARTPSTPP